MKKNNKTDQYPVSHTSPKSKVPAPRYGKSAIHGAASPSTEKEPVDTKKFNGFKNHTTWEVATYIQNNNGLHDMCRCLYEDGYKSFGAMKCKLMEYGAHWKADALTTIYWNDDDICSKEITSVLKDLFDKPKKK